jgi:uridine kinase
VTQRGPYVVGIAGPTCSGKSELANHLQISLREMRPVVISSDSYYQDLSALPPSDRSSHNFDHPDAIEWELLSRDISNLARGEEIFQPVYDFSTHTRVSLPARIIPSPVIIVEGLFVLYWPDVRRLLDMKIFVTLPEGRAITRRLERDVLKRGRNPESVLDQYHRTVNPMNEKYVLPSKAFADIVVDGSDPVDQSAARVIKHIQIRVLRASPDRTS